MNYVLMVVHDPRTGFVVGLVKQKGPSFLLDKITFPGGAIEAGECPEAAASRELLEETGIAVPEQAWQLVRHLVQPTFTMFVFAAESDQVLRARTCELEPVLILNVERHLRYAVQSPDLYAPDFIPYLDGALAVLKVTSRATTAE